MLNWNMMLHPPIAYFNLTRIERGEDFAFYRSEGAMTPSIAKIMQALDDERMAIGKALGFNMPTLAMYLKGSSNPLEPLYEAVISDDATGMVKGPTDVNHRYLTEDVPYGLVPLSELGRLSDIPTPTANAFIAIAQAVYGRDLIENGITKEKMRINQTML